MNTLPPDLYTGVVSNVQILPGQNGVSRRIILERIMIPPLFSFIFAGVKLTTICKN